MPACSISSSCSRGRAICCCAPACTARRPTRALRRARTVLSAFLVRQGADGVQIHCRSGETGRRGRSGKVQRVVAAPSLNAPTASTRLEPTHEIAMAHSTRRAAWSMPPYPSPPFPEPVRQLSAGPGFAGRIHRGPEQAQQTSSSRSWRPGIGRSPPSTRNCGINGSAGSEAACRSTARTSVPGRRQAVRAGEPAIAVQRGDLRHLFLAERQLLRLQVALEVRALRRRRESPRSPAASPRPAPPAPAWRRAPRRSPGSPGPSAPCRRPASCTR